MTSHIEVRPGTTGQLLLLTLGTFAVGTEGFMIASLLPGMATDLDVAIGTAGQLVTAFSIAYAIGSPILATVTGAVARRRLLVLAMLAFAAANLLAAAAPGYWALVGARILLALAAGLYVPAATALAGALVPPERRGRALALVGGGLTVAMAIGVPLGALVGETLGWRATFIGVGGVSAIAALGLFIGLPRGVGAGLPTASFGQRLAVARRPEVLSALAVTLLWATGGFTAYTYVAPLLAETAGIVGTGLSAALLLAGGAGALGVYLGGWGSDRLGPARAIAVALTVMGLGFVGIAIAARLVEPAAAALPILVAVAAWGLGGWAFNPAQQNRVIGIAGVNVAGVALSLHASFIYAGSALGAALGSLVIAAGAVEDVTWVAALFQFLAVGLILRQSSAAMSRRQNPPGQSIRSTAP